MVFSTCMYNIDVYACIYNLLLFIKSQTQLNKAIAFQNIGYIFIRELLQVKHMSMLSYYITYILHLYLVHIHIHIRG